MSKDSDITGENNYSCGECLRAYKDDTEYNDGSLSYESSECPRCGSHNVSKNFTIHK